MSQVAIVIDAPDHTVEDLIGNTLYRIAENTAKEIRKQLPVDDRVAVRAIVQGNDLVVTDASVVPEPEVVEPEATPEPKAKAPAKPRKPRAKKPTAPKP